MICRARILSLPGRDSGASGDRAYGAGLDPVGLGLDYFERDCAMSREEEVVLPEANATLNLFPPSDDPKFHFRSTALGAALKAFDTLSFGREPGRSDV